MTWLQTCSNGATDRAFDLMNPDWRDVDFEVAIPEALARQSRYTGHVRGGIYSIAQHCVIGADAIWRKYRDRDAAAAFLLHDAHEFVLGDKATPIAEAEVETAEQLQPGAGKIVKAMQRLMKQRIDVAIYAAAGLGNDGCPDRFRRIVAEYDLGLLATERRHLLGQAPKPWHPVVEAAEPVRLHGRITPWPWHHAAAEFRDRLRKYLPDRFGGVAANPPSKSGPRRDGARRQLEEA